MKIVIAAALLASGSPVHGQTEGGVDVVEFMADSEMRGWETCILEQTTHMMHGLPASGVAGSVDVAEQLCFPMRKPLESALDPVVRRTLAQRGITSPSQQAVDLMVSETMTSVSKDVHARALAVASEPSLAAPQK